MHSAATAPQAPREAERAGVHPSCCVIRHTACALILLACDTQDKELFALQLTAINQALVQATLEVRNATFCASTYAMLMQATCAANGSLR